MHGDRRIAAVLLAVLYAVSGVLCLVAATWPMRSDSPVAVLVALGIVGTAGGVALWALAGRVPWWALHAAVLLASALLAALAWRSATAVGVVALGPPMIALALFAAHFFGLPSARLHVAALAVLATAGAVAAQPDVPALQWLVGVVIALVLAEAQGRLAHNLRTAAATDPLTGIANRRAWEAEADRNLARAARTGEPLTFAILDLDDFKDGQRPAGPRRRRRPAPRPHRRLGRATAPSRPARPLRRRRVRPLPAGDRRARRLGNARASSRPPTTSPGRPGVAVARPGDTLRGVLARADADLYQKKRSGRTA